MVLGVQHAKDLLIKYVEVRLTLPQNLLAQLLYLAALFLGFFLLICVLIGYLVCLVVIIQRPVLVISTNLVLRCRLLLLLCILRSFIIRNRTLGLNLVLLWDVSVINIWFLLQIRHRRHGLLVLFLLVGLVGFVLFVKLCRIARRFGTQIRAPLVLVSHLFHLLVNYFSGLVVLFFYCLLFLLLEQN